MLVERAVEQVLSELYHRLTGEMVKQPEAIQLV